jgi:hypothetical protein
MCATFAAMGEAPRRRWLREPLLHFVLIGAAIFGLDRIRHGASKTSPPNDVHVVVVDAAVRDALTREYTMRFGRSPDPDRLATLIAEWVRDEVLIREAMSLGLDHGDVIIRRRLAQKMSLVLESRAAPREASESELAQWLAAHRETYRLPARTSFTHVFFARARRGDQTRADATSALANGPAPERGDAFPLGATFESRSGGDIETAFGAAFARTLDTAPVGTWTGPVTSRFGEHLVLVRARSANRDATLDEVRAAVRADFEAHAREDAIHEATARLVSQYHVVNR